MTSPRPGDGAPGTAGKSGDAPAGSRPPRPGVYARLAEEADVRYRARPRSRGARWAGWALCLALAAGVLAAAVWANPW